MNVFRIIENCQKPGPRSQASGKIIIFFQEPLSQGVKRWPTDLAVPGSSPVPVFRPSARPSAHASVRLQFTSTIAFKSIQMTFSETTAPMVLKFHKLRCFRMGKFSLVENAR